MKEFYNTIEKPSIAEYKDRGSRFLGYAFSINTPADFKKRLKELKEEHPKAAHHCFAYRIGLDGNEFRAGDDGEPSGSAGKPILGQIDSKELTNLAVVVVRYFGGTLLGVPGLINAYKMTSSLALQLTPIVQKPVMSLLELEYDYTRQNDVMVIIKRWGGVVKNQEQQLFCKLEVEVPVARVEDVIRLLEDLPTVSFKRI